jgi:quinone-modifying oxidoreductase subunit QmoC
MIVTAIVAAGHWGGKVIPAIALHTPMPLLFPVKILANIGAIMLVVGLAILTHRRRQQDPEKTRSNYYDWYLLNVIWFVTLTGIGAQLFRLADIAPVAYFVYYLHLVSVWMLFAYLPWSKLGHLVYRTAALTYVRMMGRR